MTTEQSLLIKTDLFDAIRAFHDCNDKEKREKYIKEYTLDFCKTYDIYPIEVIEKLNSLFKEQKRISHYAYKHFQNGKLGKIILPEESEHDI